MTATHDAGRLRSWLIGDDVPPGAVIDHELRWAVLQRLASLGEIDAATIDEEARRDPSSEGATHAAACRALRPDATAKEQAWQLLMTDGGASNYELFATAGGFWHPEQAELTWPYAEPYFAQIEATAKLRSGLVVGTVARLAYPATAVDQRTVDLADRLLAQPDLHPAIRRSVVDRTDDLRRAVSSRERFAR